MAFQVIALAWVAIAILVVKFLNRTDIAKVKGLPEIPGVPLFGNLLQLGSEHAKQAAAWAKTYGPVFQVRLGNKVSLSIISPNKRPLTNMPRSESSLQIPMTLSSTSGSRISRH